ncbi:uncharacterized protein K02A2.6-like [Nylanderia fulva]|uniref:uncharacterized protein K02A2.6-like n=1 Tax=Nylanderia fulva TaxID=613905 RepID=UPI0010FB695A|nr:uncharacterized protein K02A2.6-like [Nylanderia fulva]
MAGAYSSPEGNGATVAEGITTRVIYRHGCPAQIHSDNGTQFTSREFKQLLAEFGIEHRTSPVYAPHCNPVERANRTIKTMLAQYAGEHHQDWDGHLDALQFAINTARHEATGYTPAYITHGRELARPYVADRFEPNEQEPGQRSRQLQEAFELVRVHLARAFQKQERHYNLRRREWRPQPGDQVWKRDRHLSRKSEAFNAKLAPKFSGPMEVRRLISPVIVDLRDARGKWHRHVHIQDLKPAEARETADEYDAGSDDERPIGGAINPQDKY